MNILLVFATNSGTTMMTAQTVADKLTQKGHAVTMKEARVTTPDDFNSPEAIIIASPSWDFDGKEGMPHEDYMSLIEQLKSKTFEGKKFAIAGLGDSSYKHFCGAVDHFEELVKTMKGTLATPSLRIDKFFSDQTKNMEAINSWTESLSTSLSS
jgi:flavodoxin I